MKSDYWTISPRWFFICCLVSTSTLACKRENTASPRNRAATVSNSADIASDGGVHLPSGAINEDVKPGEARPGRAYFSVKGVGIVALDDTGMKVVQPLTAINNVWDVDVSLGLDGAIWVTTPDSVYRISRGKSNRFQTSGKISLLVGTSQNQAWGQNDKGVHRFAIDQRGMQVVETVTTDTAGLQGIGVESDGSLWLAHKEKLEVRKSGESGLTAVDVSKAFKGKVSIDRLLMSQTGGMFLELSEEVPGGRSKIALLARTATDWQRVTASSRPVTAPGEAIALVGDRFVLPDLSTYFELGKGSELVKMYRATLPGASNYGTWRPGLAGRGQMDRSGRTWLQTRGIAVFDKQGKKLRHWALGSTMMTGEVSSLVVTGAGPAELPLAEQVKHATITGVVIQSGSPVGKADVALCENPKIYVDASPCEDEDDVKSVKTDEYGRFALTGVPMGNYGFAVRAPRGKWSVLLGGCCMAIELGGTHDVGLLRID